VGDFEFWVILSLKIILNLFFKITIGLYCQGPVHTSENETRVWENKTNFTMHVQAPPSSPILSPSFPTSLPSFDVYTNTQASFLNLLYIWWEVVGKNEIMGRWAFRACFSCYYFCNLVIQKKWKDVLTYILT